MSSRLAICHACLGDRKRDCRGPCPCPVDGRDIIEHAKAGECPAGKYPSRGLGDTVAKVIKAVTAGRVKPCGGCEDRQAKLNDAMPYRSNE